MERVRARVRAQEREKALERQRSREKERERERDTERETEKERQRERERERRTHTHTDRKSARAREREREKEKERQREKEEGGCVCVCNRHNVRTNWHADTQYILAHSRTWPTPWPTTYDAQAACLSSASFTFHADSPSSQSHSAPPPSCPPRNPSLFPPSGEICHLEGMGPNDSGYQRIKTLSSGHDVSERAVIHLEM